MNAARVRASGAVAPVRPPTVVRSPGAPSRAAAPRVSTPARRRRWSVGRTLTHRGVVCVWGGGGVRAVRGMFKKYKFIHGTDLRWHTAGAITFQLRVWLRLVFFRIFGRGG